LEKESGTRFAWGLVLINKKVVEIVLNRAGDYCETCGSPALPSMALHHRKLKSRGGKDTPANLIRVHHGCHNLRTDSIHLQPAKAEAKGWICPSWKEPNEQPFVKPDGTIVLLQDDGSEFTMMEGD
jgi:hypothetical protein